MLKLAKKRKPGMMAAMRVERKNLPKSAVELTVEVPADEVEKFFQKAVRRLGSALELPGFRKGKAPLEMIEKYIPSRDLFEEVAERIVRDTYPKIILDERLESIGNPEIEVLKIARKDVFSYRIRVAVLPEVKLPNYKKIHVKQKRVEAQEQETQDALAYLQKSRATYERADRGAQKGDLVEIDFTLRQNNVIINGGSATHHPFILGEGRFIPGFESTIEGMREDEEKQFPLTFPADYAKKQFAGKAIACTVKVHTVQRRILPELTDEFAQKLGKFENLQALKTNAAEGITKEKKEREKTRAETELITKIAEKSRMETPDVLVEHEIEKMFSELESRLSAGGITLEQYLAHLKKTKGDLARDWKNEAEKRVRIALVLRAIAKEENIHPTPEEVKIRADETLKKYPSAKAAKKNTDPATLQEYAESTLTNEKVFEFLRKTCIAYE